MRMWFHGLLLLGNSTRGIAVGIELLLWQVTQPPCTPVSMFTRANVGMVVQRRHVAWKMQHAVFPASLPFAASASAIRNNFPLAMHIRVDAVHQTKL